MSSHPLCVHCKKNRAFRARGLCERCFYTPEVRAATPPVSKFGNRGRDPTPEEIAAEARKIREGRTRKQWDDL